MECRPCNCTPKRVRCLHAAFLAPERNGIKEAPKVESFRMISSSLRFKLAAGVICAAPVFAVGPAKADFRLCNNTSSRVGVAVGYRDKQGWLTEGWWNVSARSCESILKGPLAARFYYVYAVDYDQGGEWSGSAFMCSRDKEFTIRGFENCLARGYNRTGYFEIDTGEQRAWTVQLSEQAQNGAKPKSNAPADTPPAEGPSASGAPPANPPAVTTPPLVSPAAPSPMTPQDAPAPAAPAQPAGEAGPPSSSPPAPPQDQPPRNPPASAPPEQGTPAQDKPPQDNVAPAAGAETPPPVDGTAQTPAPPLPPERPASAP